MNKARYLNSNKCAHTHRSLLISSHDAMVVALMALLIQRAFCILLLLPFAITIIIIVVPEIDWLTASRIPRPIRHDIFVVLCSDQQHDYQMEMGKYNVQSALWPNEKPKRPLKSIYFCCSFVSSGANLYHYITHYFHFLPNPMVIFNIRLITWDVDNFRACCYYYSREIAKHRRRQQQ